MNPLGLRIDRDENDPREARDQKYGPGSVLRGSAGIAPKDSAVTVEHVGNGGDPDAGIPANGVEYRGPAERFQSTNTPATWAGKAEQLLENTKRAVRKRNRGVGQQASQCRCRCESTGGQDPGSLALMATDVTVLF